MRRPSPTLTPQELEIMKIVWQKREAKVRDVYETLLERRKVAYTTVMTMMGILEAKGHLKRRREEKAYVYCPTRPEGVVMRSMVREFINRVFDGSAQPMLVHLLKDRRLTEEEIEDLARLIKESE
jgi:predicted transcriptional regulator